MNKLERTGLFAKPEDFQTQQHKHEKIDTAQKKIFFSPQSTTTADELGQNKSIQCLNSHAAEFIGFVSRIMLERTFFQNNHIPHEILLNLSNSLIATLVPEKNETLSLSKDLSLTWKQLRGNPLTTDEKKYLETPKELDVMGEIFNGIKYSSLALMGHHLYSSITSAVKQGFWDHIPTIISYSGAQLLGSKGIAHAVERILQRSKLSQSQKTLVKPWLNMVGRLALGFMPKVHANQEGVHYHYPSLKGSMQTFSKNQTLTVENDKLTIDSEGLLDMPQGTFEGTRSAEFKLKEIYELSKERIRIKVFDAEGKTIPVEFIKVQGHYGSEIQIKCDDKILEQYWKQYLQPKKISKPQSEIDLSCLSELAIGAVSALKMLNPIPLVFGLSCIKQVKAEYQSIRSANDAFLKVFQGSFQPHDDTNTNAIQLANGDILNVGSTTEKNGFVIRYNFTGDLLSTYSIEGPPQIFLENIKSNTYGTSNLGVGMIGNNVDTFGTALFVEIFNNGTIGQIKVAETSFYSNLWRSEPTPDGGWYSIGVVQGGIVPGVGAWITKVDSDFTTTQNYILGGTVDDRPLALLLDPEYPAGNSFYLVGSTKSFGQGDYDFYLSKITSGTVVWYHTYGGTGEDVANNAKIIDDQIAIVGYSNSPGSINNGCILQVNFFLNGTLSLANFIQGSGGASDILQDSRKHIIIVGSASDPNLSVGNTDIIVVDLYDNSLVSARGIGQLGNEIPTSAFQSFDGPIILTGFTSSIGNNNNPLLIQLDFNEDIPSCNWVRPVFPSFKTANLVVGTGVPNFIIPSLTLESKPMSITPLTLTELTQCDTPFPQTTGIPPAFTTSTSGQPFLPPSDDTLAYKIGLGLGIPASSILTALIMGGIYYFRKRKKPVSDDLRNSLGIQMLGKVRKQNLDRKSPKIIRKNDYDNETLVTVPSWESSSEGSSFIADLPKIKKSKEEISETSPLVSSND